MTETTKDNIPTNIKLLILALGGFTCLIGFLVIIGWFFHLPVLIKISPAFNSLKFNTALGLFLGGFGIIFIHHQRIIVWASGILLMVLGTMTLWQYLMGSNIGIDQFFIRDYLTSTSQFPGRMAPQSALCFLLFGTGLLVDRLVKHQNIVMSWRCLCGAFLLVIGVTAIFGFFTHIPFAYTWGSYNALAVHSAIGFIFLGTAMMLTSLGNAYLSLAVMSLGGISLGLQVYYGLLQHEDTYIRSLIPWLMLSMIVLFTALIVVYLYTQIKRRIIIEKIVVSRTQEILELNMKLERLSTFDELTGLYNRRGFKFLVEQKMKEVKRSKESSALFLIDLDKMKNINDLYGHSAGDRALIDVAKLLNKSFRETDIIARWGGDEFVVLGLGASDNAIGLIKKRLETNLNNYNLSTINNFKLYMSIGEVIRNHDSQVSLEELIIEADKKMYQQKKTSRSQV